MSLDPEQIAEWKTHLPAARQLEAAAVRARREGKDPGDVATLQAMDPATGMALLVLALEAAPALIAEVERLSRGFPPFTIKVPASDEMRLAVLEAMKAEMQPIVRVADEAERLREGIQAELRDGDAVFSGGCGRPDCEPCAIRVRLAALLR